MNRCFRCWRMAAWCLVLTVLLSSMPLVAFAAYENTHQNTGNQAMDLVAVATTQIGYVEGANNNNKYADYFNNPNQPWCGYFISWCARQANIPVSVIPSSGLASAFKTLGTFHATGSGYIPKPGDIAYYSQGHVSIVERYDEAEGKVWLIDGNWSDKVSHHSVSLTNAAVEGYASPNYTSRATELTMYGLKKPTVLLKGKSFSIGGMVCSPNKLTSVKIQIQQADGKTVISASATPNAKEYDLIGLDAKIAFGTLVTGEYMFVVSASDNSGASKRWTSTFEVVSAITMSFTNAKVPMSIEEGKTFSISGTVTCDEPMTLVSVGVYDSSGTYKTGGTHNPNSTTYDIRGIDPYVSFGSLKAGNYTMRVAARSANAYKEWEYPFVVGDGKPVFTIKNVTMPDELTAGRDFPFAGKINCSSTITVASVKILKGNTTVATAMAYPNRTVFSIESLNANITFASLTAGSYRVRVAATSDGTTKEWFYDFKVVSGNGQKGDLNFDGRINTMDALMLYQHASGGRSLTSAQQAAVGISPINMRAALRLYSYTSGSIAQYP